MHRPLRLLSLAAATVLVACASSDVPDDIDGSWVGTITTEGNVTTVINKSGSVWGGAATLVEEVSIDVIDAGSGQRTLRAQLRVLSPPGGAGARF